MDQAEHCQREITSVTQLRRDDSPGSAQLLTNIREEKSSLPRFVEMDIVPRNKGEIAIIFWIIPMPKIATLLHVRSPAKQFDGTA